jgi:glycosyltransferase involved in cell wall biosynthesis
LHGFFSKFEPLPSRAKKVVFLVGSTAISGGTNLILQNALGLAEAGCGVTIAAMKIAEGPSWHPALDRLTVTTLDHAAEDSYEAVVATWWPTVYQLPRFKANNYVYFVQSIESRFMALDPRGRRHEELAHLTYRFGLDIITIARWIEIYLGREVGQPAYLIRNGIDKESFAEFGRSLEKRPTMLGHPPRLLVEGPPSVAFKGVALAITAAREAGFDDIWLVGPNAGSFPEVRAFSSVPYTQMGEIYRSCDVLLKLSEVEGMYGPPLEMFHCGGTVVTFDVTGHSEYIRHGTNALVAQMGDVESVVKHLVALRSDPELLARLRLGALDTARAWPSIADTRADFARTLLSLMSAPPRDFIRTLLEIRGASDGSDI